MWATSGSEMVSEDSDMEDSAALGSCIFPRLAWTKPCHKSQIV